MTKTTRALLRGSLVARYVELRDRLATRLGSQDLAGEALHETWLRLQGASELAPVNNPEAYIYRAALNSAAKLSAASRRVLGSVDIDDIMELADDAPGPDRIAIGRSEIAELRRILKGLTRRQRDIFLESFTGDLSHAALATRYGVSVRTIQTELRLALIQVAGRMTDKDGFATPGFRVSRK